MGDTRAVWLLDFDGILNGSRPGWSAGPRTSRALHEGHAYRVRWAPQAVAALVDVRDSGLVEILWASSWIDVGTGQIERITGLPSLPHAYPADPDRLRLAGDAFEAAHRAAKVATALAVVATGRRLIWTDDDAIPAAGPARAALDAAGALLIAPHPGRALRPEHIDAIRAYLSRPG